MFGKIFRTGINRSGYPYMIVKNPDGQTYYCDNRNIEVWSVENYKVGDSVNFIPVDDESGRLASHVIPAFAITGIIRKKDINKNGFPYGIIADQIGSTHRFDERGIEDGDWGSYIVGATVEFRIRRDDKTGHIYACRVEIDPIEKHIAELNAKLQETIKDSRYVLASDFRDIAEKSGIPDYKTLAPSVADFVEKFLPSLKHVPSIRVNGKRIPNIIALKEDNLSDLLDDDENERLGLSDEEKEKLNRLFSVGDYLGFLSSACFRKLKPRDIPVEYFEKALTAARRLVISPDEKDVQLNLFQLRLITAETEDDFSDWKVNSQHYSEAYNLCQQTVAFGAQQLVIPKLLNEIVHLSSRGDVYTDSKSKKTKGLISRFQTVRNEQLIPLFVIGAFAQEDQDSLKAIIEQYLRLIVEVKDETGNYLFRNKDDGRMLFFPSFIRVVSHAPAANNLSFINEPFQNLMLSAFISSSCVDLIDGELADMLFSNENRLHLDLINLMRNPFSWSKEKFLSFLEINSSPQLFERCLAHIWGLIAIDGKVVDLINHFRDLAVLPEPFLQLLAWSATYSAYSGKNTLEAIIDLPSINGEKKLTRKAKWHMLFYAIPAIQKLVAEDPACYNLGAYTVNYLYKDAEADETSSADLITPDIYRNILSWNEFAKNRFTSIKPDALIPPETRMEQYKSLFAEYMLDWERELLLQQYYSEEVLSLVNNRELDAADCSVLLTECYYMKAYDAFIKLYKKFCCYESIIFDETLKAKYIDSLIKIRNYEGVIDYVLADSSLGETLKKDSLARIVREVFQTYQYSPSAFAIFSERFPVEKAIELLQDNISMTSLSSVTALIAMYIRTGQFFKARYLFDIFGTKAEVGNTRIYFWFGRLLANNTYNFLSTAGENNHYKVIEKAFYALTPQGLIDFLIWASRIKIPDLYSYKPNHAHILYFNNILAAPNNSLNWYYFIQGLSKNLAKHPENAWLICVCDAVLSGIWNVSHSFDVRNAFEVALNNISITGSNYKNTPYNLLPYITSFAMRTGDIALFRKIGRLIDAESLRNHLFVRNPWAKLYSEYVQKFINYCVAKLKETGDDIYADLAKGLSPSASVEALLAIASRPGSSDYVIRQVCNYYLEGKQVDEILLLLNQIDRTSLSYRETEALELLKTAYSDEFELIDKHPELQSEEDVSRFKQNCIQILSYYPESNGMLSFENEGYDNRYKRLVYSYVSGVYYNDEIYKRYSFDYRAFKNKQDQVSIAAFLRKTFIAELVYNASFDFFYKRRRYLKLYITDVIRSEGPSDAAEIISVMKAHHHEELVLDQYFIPFKNAVDSFISSTELELEQKKCFLYCLMIGSVESTTEYLKDYSESFANLSNEIRASMKLIVSMLDYREVSYAIFSFFYHDISNKHFYLAKEAADSLVQSAYDSICELEMFKDDSNVFAIFDKINNKVASQCVNALIKLDYEQYDRYQSLINPLVCSRQYSFSLYKRFRNHYLKKKTAGFVEKYASFVDYLSKRIDPDAPIVFRYLEAMNAGQFGERERALQNLLIIRKDLNRLPVLWQEEASRLEKYASGEYEYFNANTTILDASIGGNEADNEFNFCQLILDRFKVEKEKTNLDRDGFIKAIQCFHDNSGSRSDCERAVAGSLVLCNYAKYGRKRESSYDPEVNYPLELGLFVLQSTSIEGFSTDDKIEIASELIERNLGGEKVYQLFDELLKNARCTLSCWCEHRKVIKSFISDAYLSDTAFPDLYSKVLEPCAQRLLDLHAQRYSVEEYIDDLESYMILIKGVSESSFRRPLHTAVEEELNRMKEGVRLKIWFENKNHAITDRRLYFFIKNVGTRSVSLDDCEILLQDLPVKNINGIRMLHPQYVTGGSEEFTCVGENGFTIQIRYGNAILCRNYLNKESVITAASPTSIETDNALYDVDRAVKVFGRDDELIKLKRCVERQGKALVYGPSRIGKTSILDKLRLELASSNSDVIAVTFAGEGGAGKKTDYKEIRKDTPCDKIEEALLIESIVRAFDNGGVRIQVPKSFTEEQEEKIIGILRTDESITKRYDRLNRFLDKEGLELWLILDEFQQIVSWWEPETTGAFVSVCESRSSETKIKIILCGSDELLKHMVLERASVWRELFKPKTNGVQVFALKNDKPFYEMITTEPLNSGRSISELGISYSEEALKALFLYTGGVPLYGKMICNQVLETMYESGEFNKRTIIYSSDIAQAASELVDKQRQQSSDMREILDAVKKELDYKAELILAFIAKYMDDNKTIGCPYKAFIQNERGSFKYVADGDEPFRELDDSLSIAEARGIIKRVDSISQTTIDVEPVYTFCTVFYFNAFLGVARSDSHLEERLFVKEDDCEDDTATISTEIDYNDPHEIAKGITELWKKLTVDFGVHDEFACDEQERVRKLIHGPAVQAKQVVQTGGSGRYSEGGDTYNNIQVNAQIINSAFSTVFSDAALQERLSAFNTLPKLESFYSKEDTARALELQKKKELLLQSGTIDADESTQIEVIDNELGEINSRATTKYCGEVMAGAYQTADSTPGNSIFSEPTEDDFKRILGIRKTAQISALQSIQKEYYRQLCFALTLHKLIMPKHGEDVPDYSDVDFSPISIIYCKLVEIMLKEKHLELYGRALPDLEISAGVSFEQLIKDPELLKKKWNDITIGTFTWHLICQAVKIKNNRVNNYSKFYRPQKENKPAIDKTPNLQRLSSVTGESIEEWKKHATILAEVQEIRNYSAHGGNVLSKEIFDYLLRILFSDDGGEIMRIWDLYQDSNTTE